MIGVVAEEALRRAVANLKSAELCLKFPPRPEYAQDSAVILPIMVLPLLEDCLKAVEP